MNRPRLAIIGNGMATCRLLEELQTRGGLQDYTVTVYGDEPHAGYNRILLNRVLNGGTPDEITMKSFEWYISAGVTLRSGVAVTSIDTTAKTLTLADGEIESFDRLVFATGSVPLIPPVEGLRDSQGRIRTGVYAYRTINDCDRMRAFSQANMPAVVVGGGLLGLEAAKALSDLGMHVTVLHRDRVLMNAQLDRHAGEMLQRSIEQLGIHVRTGVTVATIATTTAADGAIDFLTLTDGTTIPAQMLVFACGVRPRIELAQQAGIACERGILVDDGMATRTPNIYAVGECVEHDGRTYGLVQPVWEQCDVLAETLTHPAPKAQYRGSKLYTRLKVAGVQVAGMGLVEPTGITDEVIQVIEERRGIYRKLIIRDGILVGALLVGDGTADDAATLIQLFDRNDPLPENRLEVFCPSIGGLGTGVGASDPEICNCHHVRESVVVEAIGRGCRNLVQISSETRAGTGCGSCRGQIANLIMCHGSSVH